MTMAVFPKRVNFLMDNFMVNEDCLVRMEKKIAMGEYTQRKRKLGNGSSLGC